MHRATVDKFGCLQQRQIEKLPKRQPETHCDAPHIKTHDQDVRLGSTHFTQCSQAITTQPQLKRKGIYDQDLVRSGKKLPYSPFRSLLGSYHLPTKPNASFTRCTIMFYLNCSCRHRQGRERKAKVGARMASFHFLAFSALYQVNLQFQAPANVQRIAIYAMVKLRVWKDQAESRKSTQIGRAHV